MATTPKTYTLTLTEDQAEIVGFALSKTITEQRKAARESLPGARREGCLARVDRMQEVAAILDSCPMTDESGAA